MAPRSQWWVGKGFSAALEGTEHIYFVIWLHCYFIYGCLGRHIHLARHPCLPAGKVRGFKGENAAVAHQHMAA
jgi:hypothetical protein